MPSVAIVSAKRGAEVAVKPRTWMLPRAVISMMPLPCARAAAHSAVNAAKRDRADRQQPHQQSVAGRHRRRQPGTRAAPFPSPLWGGVRGGGREICASVRHHAATSARSAARPASISLRRGCQKPRRRAASNRSAIAAAACGFSRSRKVAHVGVGDIGVVQQIEQFAGDRVGRFARRRQPVDGLGKLGGAARAVAHLPGDEARIDRAPAHDARQRRRQRARPRPLRIGHVEHDEIGRAAEHFRRRGKAADEGGILGAFEEIAAGIVARMHEQIGAGDALRERAGRRACRLRRRRHSCATRRRDRPRRWSRCRHRGRANPRRRSHRRRARCRRCDQAARRRRGAACLRGQRVLVIGFLARGDRLHGGIDERDLRGKEIAEQPGNAPGDVDPRAPDRRRSAALRRR